MIKAPARPMMRVVPLTCLALTLLLASPLGGALPTEASTSPAPAGAAATATAADPPDAAHPYSDPVWSPLRTPARVNCVRTNCAGPYHGYWAIDFIGNLGDPLYAAGAGIFHIGGINRTCAVNRATAATWVWIDHGAGRTTRYQHLDTVLPREGQLVTPMTKIGTMGHSGYKCSNSPPNYLHMEYRIQGATGPRVAPRAMTTCLSNGPRVSMPSRGLLMGTLSGLRTSKSYPTWNDVPANPNPGCVSSNASAASPTTSRT